MSLFLSPESIRATALVILNVALTVYLLRVPRGAGASRWLAGFTTGTVGLYLCRAAEASFYPLSDATVWAIKSVELLVVMVALGALVQFAYRFLEVPYPRETRAALVLATLAIVGSLVLVAVTRSPESSIRDVMMSVYSFTWFVADAWAVTVLLRKRRRAHASGRGREARAFAAFAAVCLADAVLLITIIGVFLADASVVVSNAMWVFVILPAVFAIHYTRVAIYLEHAPEPTSIRTKLSGLALALVLGLIGMTAVLSAPPSNPNVVDGIPAPEVMAEYHEAMLPLLVLMGIATVLALVVFPWALKGSLVRPVERLLEGVRRVNAGERDVTVPVGVHDEVGRLSEGFNAMTASLQDAEEELRAYATDLEVRVAARTEELRASKAEVEAQALRLEELDRLKTRLFANLSHEFRTPLTILLGPIEDALASDTPMPEPLAGQLPSMQQSARRLLDLINQLLDLAKLEAGALDLNSEETDVVALARGVAATFAGPAERKGLGLLFDAQVSALSMPLDAQQIETVLTNLVANALAFTERGGKIRVSVGAEHGDAVVAVEDTGTGIAAAALPYVFDRFRQADGSTTRTHGGTGIGLALAKELVELHGGTIGVESTVGFGTRFTVRLPLGAVDVDAEAAAQAGVPTVPRTEQRSAPTVLATGDGEAAMLDLPIPVSATPGDDPPAVATSNDRRPLVLVVEDHAGLRAYIRSHLAERYRVLEAENGAVGLETARACRPDLVLSDVMMPELDGVALTRALRAEPALADVPIVLLSAWADEQSTLAGLEAGADDYLTKPFSPDELRARLSNFVATRHRLRARYSDEVVVGPSEIVVPSAEAAFLERVRDAAEAGLGDPSFGVDALAAEVGLSRRQLGRRLRASLDTAPGVFLRQLRLARAAQLLTQQAGTVAEVAYAVGYRDADHFAKQFRKTYGTLPSAYATRKAVPHREHDDDH
ncbi:MAG: ATP-binding protein [Bacteroidota bacterium]